MSSHRIITLRSVGGLLYKAGRASVDDRVIRLGAGVAYYSLFTLVPVLLLAVTFASIFLGQETVKAEVRAAIEELLGADIASAIMGAIEAVDFQDEEVVVSLITVGVLIFTATLLFVAWKEVVDIVWGLPRTPGVKANLQRRIFGLLAVLGSGVLLTLTLVAEAIVGALNRLVPDGTFDLLIKLTSSLVAAVLGAVFLAVLFKYTPDMDVSWRSVWLGAAVSMALLAVGAWGYGVYLDRYGFSSAVGVAGSLFLGLAFVYYAVSILLYGTEVMREVHMRLVAAEAQPAE